MWPLTSCFAGGAGLVLDMHLGNVLELSFDLRVFAAFHGSCELSAAAIEAAYGNGAVAMVRTAAVSV